MRVVFFTNIPSPFMLELSMALNGIDNIEYYMCFCEDSLQDRGKHWGDQLNIKEKIFYYKTDVELQQWLKEILEFIKPNIVITGYNKGTIYNTIAHHKGTFGYKLGKWNEQPPLYNQLKINRLLRCIFLKKLWRNKVDFILAIGDRAVEDFKKHVDNPVKVFHFPYAQKLKITNQPKTVSDKIVFLFSGRLIKRNNIRNIILAIIDINRIYSGQFEFIISAKGDEMSYIERCMQKYNLAECIRFDTDFVQWDDRLRPFKEAHILLVPSYHSGWGLVVSEALAMGLPVITTNKVAASRYFIEHMINGIIINTSKKEIFMAMEHFIINPQDITRMSKNALEINTFYNLDKSALILKDILFSELTRNVI